MSSHFRWNILRSFWVVKSCSCVFFAENTIFIGFLFWMISKIWMALQWHLKPSFFFLIFISPENYQFCILKNGCFFQVRTLKLQHVQKVVATHTFFFEFFTPTHWGFHDPIWLSHCICLEMGWVKNHQLVIQVPFLSFLRGVFILKKMSMGHGCHSPAVRRMDPEDLKIELKESKAMDECKVEGNMYMAAYIYIIHIYRKYRCNIYTCSPYIYMCIYRYIYIIYCDRFVVA